MLLRGSLLQQTSYFRFTSKISLEEPEHQLRGKDGEAGESEEDVGEDAQCLVVGVRLPSVVKDDPKVGEVVAEADSLG